jgi:hypothetical protein
MIFSVFPALGFLGFFEHSLRDGSIILTLAYIPACFQNGAFQLKEGGGKTDL